MNDKLKKLFADTFVRSPLDNMSFTSGPSVDSLMKELDPTADPLDAIDIDAIFKALNRGGM